MSVEEHDEGPTGKRLEHRIKWERDRARGKRSDNERPQDYAPIVFPDPTGLRHAALVVCAAHLKRKNGIAEAREICWALGIPQILANGGDGRPVRVERPRVDPEDLPPLGYDENDVGRPVVRPRHQGKRGG